MVAVCRHVAQAVPSESYGRHPHFARGLQRRKHVRRAAGRRYREKDVASAAQAPHLTFERLIESIIVANRSQYRGIGRESNRRERIAVEVQSREELASDMLRIGGAATIARNQE